MTCDDFSNGVECNKNESFFVAGPRPSDPTEIVSTLAFCEEHAKRHKIYSLDQLKGEWDGKGLVLAHRKDWSDYIESREARDRKHIFLSI